MKHGVNYRYHPNDSIVGPTSPLRGASLFVLWPRECPLRRFDGSFGHGVYFPYPPTIVSLGRRPPYGGRFFLPRPRNGPVHRLAVQQVMVYSAHTPPTIVSLGRRPPNGGRLFFPLGGPGSVWAGFTRFGYLHLVQAVILLDTEPDAGGEPQLLLELKCSFRVDGRCSSDNVANELRWATASACKFGLRDAMHVEMLLKDPSRRNRIVGLELISRFRHSIVHLRKNTRGRPPPVIHAGFCARASSSAKL